MRRSKLSDREILAAVNLKATNAYGADGLLEAERANALDYYFGRPFGDEQDGRSDVVTRDVLETIEWILPSLMRIFAGGDKVVEFEPVGIEDEEAAKQESDVLNHVILKQNNAFITFMTWFKDALLSKTAYVKVYWDEKEDTTEETYQGLTDDEMQFIAADKDVEIIQHWIEQEGDPQMTPDGQMMPPPMSHGVKVKRTSKSGKVCIEPVPPEEIRISSRVKGASLHDADYVEHRTQKTLSDIRLMGLDIDDKVSSGDERDEGVLANAREQYEESVDQDNEADPSMREVLFRDVTIRIDANGDGIAELKRYYIVGDTILATYDAENVYYACIGPIPMPHRHVGLSMADLVMDLQRLRSLLLRAYIDNLFLQNNGRYAISKRVNLDDMLVNRPGGVVRVDGEPAGAILPLVHPSNGQAAIQGLEYLDTHKENRTGVTKYNQGLDAGSLNKTATGISKIMGASQQRLELIARIFAETGVKDAFLLVHELLKKHSTKELSIKLNNKYISVDPRQWKTRTDMTVSVGLGTGDKDQQQAHIMTIMQVQREGLQIGITTPSQIYSAAKRLSENAGFKDGNEFFTDPSQQQQQEPKPDPEMMKMQAEQQMAQTKMQGDQERGTAEMQLKQTESDRSMQLEQAKLQMQMQVEQMKLDSILALEQAKMQAQMELERYKIDANIQLEHVKLEARTQSDHNNLIMKASQQSPL